MPDRCSLRVKPADERLRWCLGRSGRPLRELEEPASLGEATVMLVVVDAVVYSCP